MAQQTALEWLKDMLEWNYGDPQMLEISWENLDDLLERAKQMEKKQIINAYDEGFMDHEIEIEHDITVRNNSEQYYNETYNK